MDALKNMRESRDPAQARFTTTHWSVVVAAGSADVRQAADALEKLCEAYWFPLYSYLRRQGKDAHAAKDLIQDFLARFLAGNAFENVDQ